MSAILLGGRGHTYTACVDGVDKSRFPVCLVSRDALRDPFVIHIEMFVVNLLHLH